MGPPDAETQGAGTRDGQGWDAPLPCSQLLSPGILVGTGGLGSFS